MSAQHNVTAAAALLAPITTTAVVGVLGLVTELRAGRARRRQEELDQAPHGVDYAAAWWDARQTESTSEGLHSAAVTVLAWLDESRDAVVEPKWRRLERRLRPARGLR
ncbi:hypothetical protein [Antrihabitans cavernicola]|uniref:Uncharacterized protein n=1 Tax=Antrihabitans cavernicola TaxID=2495913 RepID=A0A5A7S960_9NOCA|nr:hypothetical protein [Spelaeibacter cavernicola]KAA0019468.1 hypothetical protein FOY51_22755 [Spelaeibacter cavernicola]